ncbi:MAG: helix-turn-helix transcriptional regulator [Pyrinomonadaceae bacterium]
MTDDRLIKAEVAASILCVSTQRIWELSRRHLIPHVRIGERQYRYSERALREWIASGGRALACGDNPQIGGHIDAA